MLKKKGGKSDFGNKLREELTAAVIVCSDTISAGHKEDKAGKVIISNLEKNEVAVKAYEIIPDEVEIIQKKTQNYVDKGFDLVIFTGGTGLSKRDVTPEALDELIERRIPGIEEAIRSYGQNRTPYSMLSRSLAGTINKTLVFALPGSTNGAKESMEAVFPAVLHVFGILKGARHD